MRYIGGCTLPLLTNLLLTSWDIQTDPHQAAHFGTSNVNPSTQTTWCFHPISGIQLPSSVILNSRSSCRGLGPSPLNSFSRKTISAEEPPWRLSEVVGTSHQNRHVNFVFVEIAWVFGLGRDLDFRRPVGGRIYPKYNRLISGDFEF